MIEKEIGEISFRLMDPETVREMSAVRVVVPDIYDDAGYPIEGGLMDLKMGVVNPGLRCKTCGGRKDTCPGHFGHIELVRPVIHVGFGRKIYDLLRTTCSECGKITLTEEKVKEIEKEPEKGIYQFRKIRNKAKKREKCPHCEAEQKKIEFIKPTSYRENGQRLRPNEIRERLERIPEEHLEPLNISKENKPEWMILTVLPVPPATTRPSITLESGDRSEDDLTHKLIDLLRINQRLADNLSAGAPQPIIEDLWDLLQYHVTTFMNNSTTGIPAAKHRSGKSLQTLFERIKGKEGRIKGNLTGKRVNFSGRSVISPDPSISIGEVGMPLEMAEELTVPMKVTKKNIEKAKEYIENEEHPKANYVKRPTGEKIKITEFNKEELIEELEPGYTVERQLKDGDPVIFNRQPSLHRQSMMAHRAKIMPGKTIRINDGIAIPYNADFDGDEMNVHIPQTTEAQVEADNLLRVSENLLSPKDGEILAGHQDYVTGLAVMTTKGTKFTKKETLRLLKKAGINKLPGDKDKKEYTGREIISELIPNSIDMEAKSNLSEEKVKIEDGQIKTGTLDENTFGPGGKLTREIADEEGVEEARRFIDRIGRVTVEALMMKGHTITMKDYELDEKINKERKKIIKKKEDEAKKDIKAYKEGRLEPYPGKTEKETLEAKVREKMSEINSELKDLVYRSFDPKNPGVIMTKSGARGDWKNLVQMSSALGQAAVEGKRLEKGYKGRILPHQKRETLSPQDRGFIPNSFLEGLTPIQLFQNAMDGRDSEIDKGLNTRDSGYLYKRAANALIDLKVEQDKTVRSASNQIIQFNYGEDKIHPQNTRGEVGIDIKKIKNKVLKEKK